MIKNSHLLYARFKIKQTKIDTTTVANGGRENPFPSISTISDSIPLLLTKKRTKTATPTPASMTS